MILLKDAYLHPYEKYVKEEEAKRQLNTKLDKYIKEAVEKHQKHLHELAFKDLENSTPDRSFTRVATRRGSRRTNSVKRNMTLKKKKELHSIDESLELNNTMKHSSVGIMKKHE